MRIMLCAVAAGLLAACASTGEQRAESTEVCVLSMVKLDRMGHASVRPNQLQAEPTRANCAANRADMQIAANRNIQRQNEVRNFPAESPPT